MSRHVQHWCWPAASTKGPEFVTAKNNLPGYARPRAKWYMNKWVKGRIEELLTGSGIGGLTASEVINGLNMDRFLGAPIVEVESMPSADANSQVIAVYGDLSLAGTFGDRQTQQVSRDTSLGFTSDTIYYKATERIDFVAHDVGVDGTKNGAVTGIITAAS
jgi:HK97 family phage major capsid protein